MRDTAAVSIDIGGTNVRVALVSTSGRVLVRYHSPCLISEGLTSFLQNIRSQYLQLLSFAKSSGFRIMGVGAGVPGLISADGTVVSSVNLKPLDGFNLKHWLSSNLSQPAVILNDANAAALAEHTYGAGKGYDSLLHLTLGTGVGSGLILNGRIWTGIDGVASEFGHVTVEPEGHLCQCGNKGCLEQYASASAIAFAARGGVVQGIDSALSLLPLNSIDTCTVATAARNGDLFAADCFNQAGRYLGIAAAGAVNMLNLEAIVIGGGVAASFDLFAPSMIQEMEKRAFAIPVQRVRVLQGVLGDDAGIMGAAAALFSKVSSS